MTVLPIAIAVILLYGAAAFAEIKRKPIPLYIPVFIILFGIAADLFCGFFESEMVPALDQQLAGALIPVIFVVFAYAKKGIYLQRQSVLLTATGFFFGAAALVHFLLVIVLYIIISYAVTKRNFFPVARLLLFSILLFYVLIFVSPAVSGYFGIAPLFP